MQLTSGDPLWRVKDGFLATYLPITTARHCDVAVIGGGITGAILTQALIKEGYDTAVIDCRNFGWGSTAASTALIQYEIDTHLTDLSKSLGIPAAETAYRVCRDAVDKIQNLCRETGAGDFAAKESVYFASRTRDVRPMRAEFEARQKCGLEVEWLTEADLRADFDVKSTAAIRSRTAGELDAFSLAHALLKQAAAAGATPFARTEVTAIETDADGVILRTNRGPEIRSRWVVVAAGYESLAFLKQKPAVRMHNTFAFATEPITDFVGWPRQCLLWESARPYVYARTTADGRAMFGGEDIPFKSPLIRDRMLPRKIAKLERRWAQMFPRIPLELCVTWAGTFAETPDGLPYIGFPQDQPRTFFALAYGGNGITYSMIASEMLIAALKGEAHPCAPLFQIERH